MKQSKLSELYCNIELDLINYFNKRLTSEALHHIILSSVIKEGSTTKIIVNDDLKKAYFVKTEDIVKICDDYLKGNLNDTDLYVIGFIIFGSDNIEIEENQQGDRILDVVGDWANYEIDEPINKSIVQKWKQFILDEDALLDTSKDQSKK